MPAWSPFRSWSCAAYLLTAWAAESAAAQWDPLAVAEHRRTAEEALTAIKAELARLVPPAIGAQVHQRLGFHGQHGDPARITIDLGRDVKPDEVVLFAARSATPARGVPGGGFPPDIRVSISPTGADDSFETIAEWREEADGAARDLPLLRLRGNDRSGRHLRLEIRGARERDRLRYFTLGEVVVLEDGANRALGATVSGSAAIDAPPHWHASNLTDGFLWCDTLSVPADPALYGYHSVIETTSDLPKWVEVDLGAALAIDEIRLVPAHPGNYADVAGFGFPPRFTIEAFPGTADAAAVTVFDSGTEPYPNPGDAAVVLPGRGVIAQRVRVSAGLLWQRSNDFIFALAELEVYAGRRNVALGKAVSAKDQVDSTTWANTALVDGSSGQRALLTWPDWLAERERYSQLTGERDALIARIVVLDREYQDALVRVFVILTAIALLAAGLVLLGLHWRQRRQRERLRQHIARDLHDEVGSRLSHLALLAETDAAGPTMPAAPGMAAFAREVRDVQRSMRDLAWLLDPANGDAQDFASRLRLTCQQLLAPAVAEVRVTARGQPPARRLPLEWSREVLLFAKEALTNCARHSGSGTADIVLEWSADAFTFTLQDHGRGFDEHAAGFAPGAGLRNLRARAANLGATMKLAAVPNGGTCICLSVPLPRTSWFRRIVPWRRS